MIGDNQIGQDLERLVDLVRSRRFDAAVEALKEFLARFPDNEVANGLLAATYFEIGLPAKAAAGYQRTIELNPDNALARFQLGMVRFSQGEHQAALDTWKPLTTDTREFMARFHSALACIQLGETQRALAFLEGAAENMPASHPLFPQLKSLRAHLIGDEPNTGYRQ